MNQWANAKVAAEENENWYAFFESVNRRILSITDADLRLQASTSRFFLLIVFINEWKKGIEPIQKRLRLLSLNDMKWPPSIGNGLEAGGRRLLRTVFTFCRGSELLISVRCQSDQVSLNVAEPLLRRSLIQSVPE